MMSLYPGSEWDNNIGVRGRYWSLMTLISFEVLLPFAELSHQAVEHRRGLPGRPPTSDEKYVAVYPRKQKTIYSSSVANERAQQPWMYAVFDNALNVPAAVFRLLNRLDRWQPGWRALASDCPAFFRPQDGFPPRRYLSGEAMYNVVQRAATATLTYDCSDLIIGNHVFRKSCHVAWSNMLVADTVGGKPRLLSTAERDMALGRSTEWDSETLGSARHYDDMVVSRLLLCIQEATRTDFQAISSIRGGRSVNHSQLSHVPASAVRDRSATPERWPPQKRAKLN